MQGLLRVNRGNQNRGNPNNPINPGSGQRGPSFEKKVDSLSLIALPGMDGLRFKLFLRGRIRYYYLAPGSDHGGGSVIPLRFE